MTFNLEQIAGVILTTARIFKPEMYDEIYLAVQAIKQGYETSQTGDYTAFTADLAVILAKVKDGEQIL
jgi:hypothetical protein